MAQRHMCPSTGALRRSLLAEIPAAPGCSSRAFHNSTRRLEEQPGDGAPATPAPTTRKARSTNALKQITNLGQRLTAPGAAGGLARGSFPSGQMVRRTSRPQATGADESGATPEGTPSNTQRESSPRFAKFAARPTTTHGSAPPGQMVRAPSQLRITRTPMGNATVGSMRGPNLRGRDGNRSRGPGGPQGSRSNENRPKRREKDQGGSKAVQKTGFADVEASQTLSDGMVHHLLRLQRKEWDRVPYEPKYAQGSFAANELIHAGRELFKGEVPPVKIWGPLERRIGVVGMFGAEAHLKVRRVGDGDAEPFGQEILEVDGAEVQDAEKKEAAVQ